MAGANENPSKAETRQKQTRADLRVFTARAPGMTDARIFEHPPAVRPNGCGARDASQALRTCVVRTLAGGMDWSSMRCKPRRIPDRCSVSPNVAERLCTGQKIGRHCRKCAALCRSVRLFSRPCPFRYDIARIPIRNFDGLGSSEPGIGQGFAPGFAFFVHCVRVKTINHFRCNFAPIVAE